MRSAWSAWPLAASAALGACVLVGCAADTEDEAGSPESYVLIGSAGEKAKAEILSYSPLTGETVQLTHNGVADTDAEVSPDGTTILFVRATTPKEFSPTELWLMDADGTNERRLTSDHTDLEPAWAWDGNSVIFSRQGKGEGVFGNDIVELRLADRQLTTVVDTDDPFACATAPSPSPDGAQLVFKSYDECPRYTSGFWTLENGKKDLLLCGGGTVTDFSSDGRLAFDDMGLEGFARMSIENSDCSGETVEIPKDERFSTIGEPHWSPDAAWIAFGADDGIWIVHPDGAELRKLPGISQLDEADWRAVPESG